MKKINEQKLQAFQIGAMGQRPLSRREQEERRKREEETAAAHAFKEFVETFQEAPSTVAKVWVKAGTYDAGSRREDNREKGKLYKPTSKLDEKSDRGGPSTSSADDYTKLYVGDSKKESVSSAVASATKKKSQEKKKSNLELFKEELRQIQEEREERYKYKSIARTMIEKPEPVEPVYKDEEFGSMDDGDPKTTNIYLGNLSPKITEIQLMELFGRYGPLASIKIMWPRSEEEKSRGRNCGFVAYMSRIDAERALKNLNGRDVMGYEMKLGWGKSLTVLNHPIYIPPAFVEHVMPPPPSGLPFNAQPQPNDASQFPPKEYFENYHNDPDVKRDMEEIAKNCIVKVMIPTERPLLALVHRMIEFVVREGPMFEAMIMSREIENPLFRFLFENESPAHIYYRWKLFSILQGDPPGEWRQAEYRMFLGGPIWKPPSTNFYTQGMPEELIVDDGAPESNKGALSTAQRDRLEDLIRHLTPERAKIGDTMIFCIEHADAADEICECIEESLSNVDTVISKKIARLYLISDILHNCSVKVSNASFFRTSMEKNLELMFKHLNSAYMALDSRLKAEGFKLRVLQVFKAWEDWAVYTKDFLVKLKYIFLGRSMIDTKVVQQQDIDGAPMSGDEKEDEDLDGVPLDGAALLKSAMMRGIPAASSPGRDNQRGQDMGQDSDYDDDIDGIPLDEDIDGIPLEKLSSMTAGGFIPSKWETVDPEQIEAQAITTSKWDTLDPVAPEPPALSEVSNDNDDSLDAADVRDFDEEKRTRLREIEVKIVQYQDEIESGSRSLKPGWTIHQQIEHYRRKLMKKSDKEFQQEIINTSTADSPSEKYFQSSRKDSKRSPSPTEHVSRKSKKSKRSPSPTTYSRGSPSRLSRSRKSKSPQYSKKSSRDSLSPPPSTKASKMKRVRSRSRSRSFSESPKRYIREKQRSRSSSVGRVSNKYDSPRRYRSPSPVIVQSKSSRHQQLQQQLSPTLRSSTSRRSPSDRNIRSIREQLSPVRYVKSPSRHRSDKHRHKHKYN